VVLTLGLAAYLAAAVPGPLRTTRGGLGLAAVALLLGGLVARAPGALPWSIGLLGISAAVAMLAGATSVEIVQAAQERHVDLIVIGHSGHSGVWGMFLGTTAEKVSRHASCSVLIVR